MNKKQSGFTVIEVLLCIIAVTLFVGVGMYGYNSIKAKNSAKSDSTDTVVARKGENAKKDYFEFKDLGVKFEKNKDNSDFIFVREPEVPGTVYVSSPRFEQALDKCYNSNEGGGSIGAFSKGEGQYNPDEAMGGLARQFNDFHIMLGYPNGMTTCDNEAYQDEFSTVFGQLKNTLTESVESVEQL